MKRKNSLSNVSSSEESVTDLILSDAEDENEIVGICQNKRISQISIAQSFG